MYSPPSRAVPCRHLHLCAAPWQLTDRSKRARRPQAHYLITPPPAACPGDFHHCQYQGRLARASCSVA
ncbi:hypothetical protein PoB_006572800 [Plakobranchus ocellatus]|uniref:Uncharacterized protein n=1 Tax=Plakobranchus ocellatus TaxID=259542 RepID=A0AAV4D4T4_9GAST|nr:hypothetical protein PoB_006572800 [Plakobranchus ocellatus]